MTCGGGFGNLRNVDCDRTKGEEGDTEVVHLILAGIAFQASTLVKKNE